MRSLPATCRERVVNPDSDESSSLPPPVTIGSRSIWRQLGAPIKIVAIKPPLRVSHQTKPALNTVVAMRTGSVIARIQIQPTQRPYNDHHAYCLFYSKGICGKCISRCPVEALSKAGHDKIKCLSHLKPVTEDYVKAHYGFDGYGCGLCQTKVPCESKIPIRQDVE